MAKTKPRGLLEGKRKKIVMRKLNDIKWNQSINNSSMSDITSFYQKRIRILRNCNDSLRENNEDLAKSLADQKATAQTWYNESISLKTKLLEYHERIVGYQLADTGKQEEAVMAEVERRVASLVLPIKAAIKSGLDNAIALADDLHTIRTITDSLPTKKNSEDSYQKSPIRLSEMSTLFPSNTGLPPLINRTSPIFSEGIVSASEQKMLKISEIMRAQRAKTKETPLSNDMSVIEELASSDNDEDVADEQEKAEVAAPSVEVELKKRTSETIVVRNLRRSKRQSKMSTNFRLHLDVSSDSDDESGTDSCWRSSIESSSSASSKSDYEKHKVSGSFVSKRSRNTRSGSRISKMGKTSVIDSLCLSNDSVLEDRGSFSGVSPDCCDKGILITPSPLVENEPVGATDEGNSPQLTMDTSMEFTECLPILDGGTDSPSGIILGQRAEEEPRTKKIWFKSEKCGYPPEDSTFTKTPYDTTMMDASPSFHFGHNGSPRLCVDQNLSNCCGSNNMESLHLSSDQSESEEATSVMNEANKENSPVRRSKRRPKRTSRLSEISHSNSLSEPAMTPVPDPAMTLSPACVSPLVKIKVERISSLCPTTNLDFNLIPVKESPSVTEEPTQGRRRRAAAPLSLKEPKMNRKYRQGDGSSIYSEAIPQSKKLKRRTKK